jgi:Icc-related predicted phosphoesterase
MIRIAAAGDVHAGLDSVDEVREAFEGVDERADALLLAGDLTKLGLPEEAEVLAKQLAPVTIPIVAVLGNHDHHSDRPEEVRRRLEDAGVTVLEGERCVLEIDGMRIGVAGTKGFGGGFAGSSGTEFGEPEMKAFIRHTRLIADELRRALDALDTDVRIALLHCSPVPDTLQGEPLEIYPFLGSYLLAEAIDEAGADLVLHGHAHRGIEWGITPGGTRVRNVAQHVIRRAYTVFTFDPERLGVAAG